MNSELENCFAELTKFNLDAKVFDWICKNMGKGNEITISQVLVAKEFGTSRQSIARVILKLELLRFVVKIGKIQHNYIYLVNPNKVWRGDGKLQAACCEKFAKALQ